MRILVDIDDVDATVFGYTPGQVAMSVHAILREKVREGRGGDLTFTSVLYRDDDGRLTEEYAEGGIITGPMWQPNGDDVL